MIIGINGYAGSGKDTAGILIQYLVANTGQANLEEVTEKYAEHQWWLEEQSGWELKKWAGKLKQIASILSGIPSEKFEDQEFKKTNMGPEWSDWLPYNSDAPWIAEGEKTKVPMTVREFLQKIGTDGLRTGLHTNTWVNALMADYTSQCNWVITDTRFPNEAQAIKDAGGIVIRIDRPGVTAINAHPSETSLDNWNFDYKIANVSDRFALMQTLQTILEKHNLL